MASVVVGLDLGTSGLKALALDTDGGIVAETEADCTITSPHDTWAETDPAEWTGALERVLADLVPHLRHHRVAAVGVDAQMHGVVLVDADGSPTRPAVLWPDRRAEDQTRSWRELPQQQRARLANPITAGMAGPILAWLNEHEPEAIASADHALQPKDYLRCALAGPAVTDRSDASATLLWDVVADDWAHDVLEAVGVPADLLPPVEPSAAVIAQGITIPTLDQHDVAVVTGAGDTAAALLACGGLRPGQVQVNLGTGAQVTIAVQDPHADANPVTNLFADAEQGWYAMAAVQNAGLALDKARGWLAMSWDELFEGAVVSEPGAGGVSMLPFLSGERSAIASPASTGVWAGLTTRTTREHLARAAVEAVVFTLVRAVNLLDTTDPVVRLTGGGARQRLVPELLADVLARPVEVITLRSPSALGAALLAARGVDLTIPTERLATATRIEPDTPGHLEEAFELWDHRRPLADL
ncbi:MAG: FGGY family carbohydrate kinase [Ornithinimicrobium sp.]|uniref:FGGY family carbohydrate kinase n=1 Tax=Ornithinimicrobium sp. TaxID=1977084 RepID=UPI003D9BD95E